MNKQTVLLIEDNPLMSRMYQLRLEIEGFEVEVAFSEKDALKVLGRKRPEAIALNLMVFKGEGVALVKRLRQLPNLKGTRIVAFSSDLNSTLAEEARQAGAVTCLAKSDTGPKQLVKALRTALSPKEEKAEAISQAIELPAKPLDYPAQTRQLLGAARSDVIRLLQTQKTEDIEKCLAELVLKIQSITTASIKADAKAVAQLSSGLEAMVQELIEKPASRSPSTFRSINQAVQLLNALFQGPHPRLLQLSVAGSRVLIVDDDIFSIKAAKLAMEMIHLDSESFEDPLKAWNRLQEQRFDLIISDIRMPDMDGFELCGHIRQLPAYQSTPMVLITAADSFQNRLQSAGSGANDFIAKPYPTAELGIKVLTQLLQAKASADVGSFHSFKR